MPTLEEILLMSGRQPGGIGEAPRGMGMGPAPVGLPVPPAAPAAPEDPWQQIMRLMEPSAPEPLSRGQRVGLSLSDAIQGMLALKHGRPMPESSVQRAEDTRRYEAGEKTQAYRAKASILAGRESEATRQRERGEDIGREDAAIRREEDAVARARREQKEDYNRRRTDERGDSKEDAEREFRNDLLVSAADLGALGEMDPETVTNEELLSAVSRRRFETARTERGERAALQDRERLTEATADAESVMTAFMLGDPGDPAKGFPATLSMEERLAKGDKPSRIQFEFERQLAPLQLDDATKARIMRDFKAEMFRVRLQQEYGPKPAQEVPIGPGMRTGINPMRGLGNLFFD